MALGDNTMATIAEGVNQKDAQIHDDAFYVFAKHESNKFNREMQDREYDYQRKLNEQMALLNKGARRSSALDMVAGLRAAGLSPALATGTTAGSTSSGGGVSSPASAPSRPTSALGNIGGLVQAAQMWPTQKKLMDAQAHDLESSAESKDIENQSKKDENYMVNGLLQDWVDRHLDSSNPDEKATAEYMRDQNEAYTKGSLNGLDYWTKFTAEQKERAMSIARSEYEKRIYDLRNSNDVARVIYDLPKHERNMMLGQIMQTQQMLLNMRSEKNLTETQINLFKEQAAKVTQEAAKIYHTDPAAMWDNEDWRNLLLYGGEKVLDASIEIGGEIATQKGKVRAAKEIADTFKGGRKGDNGSVYVDLNPKDTPLRKSR